MLGDGAAWERLADSVAVEVRRHGAPAPAPASPQAGPPAPAEAVGESVPLRAVMQSPTALAVQVPLPPPPPLTRDIAAPSVTMSNVVHIDNRVDNSNSKASNIGNSANTSIVFL